MLDALCVASICKHLCDPSRLQHTRRKTPVRYAVLSVAYFVCYIKARHANTQSSSHTRRANTQSAQRVTQRILHSCATSNTHRRATRNAQRNERRTTQRGTNNAWLNVQRNVAPTHKASCQPKAKSGMVPLLARPIPCGCPWTRRMMCLR